MNYATRRAVMFTIAAFALATTAWGVLTLWQRMRTPALSRIEGSAEDSATTSTLPVIEPSELKGMVTSSVGLVIPAGFQLVVFAEGMNTPRDMTLDERGTLLVSDTAAGSVLALPDTNGDGRADEIISVVSGLKNPHGIVQVCRPDCFLYVAEENALRRYAYDPVTRHVSDPAVLAKLSGGGLHVTRSLLYLTPPEGDRLLLSIGSSCDVCREENNLRATVQEVNLKTGELTPFAVGLRNSVFMAQHPVTGDIWATDMGRDGLGDDLPPDEVNIVTQGRNYGWPICYGKNVHDEEFDTNVYIRNPCQEPTEAASHIDLDAHVAPLGLAFVPEEGWPEAWWHNLLVAEHGTSQADVRRGYRIARMPLDPQGNPAGEAQDFITGFLPEKDGDPIGRPADLLIFPGGTLYFSDDTAGKVYRMARAPS
ncbi:MAG: PQQ-dependent sugar dehydrogenase [Patescibacteria group bacterium]